MNALKKVSAEELDALLPKQAADADAAPAPEKPAKLAPALPATAAQSGLLDLGFIRTKISILEIADKLGLKRRGRSALCVFHLDRQPSMSFYKNRFHCHSGTCGARGGVLDLVVEVLGCDLRGALSWLVAQGYAIPMLEPEARRRWRGGRAGVGSVSIDALVQSGLLGRLSKAEGLILCALCGLSDPTTQKLEISWTGLMRRSGIKWRGQISQALKVLRRLGLLHWERGKLPGGWRAPSTYSLTVDLTSCGLAVEKLLASTFDGTSTCTVRRDQSTTRCTTSITSGKPPGSFLGKAKKKSRLWREVDPGPKSPPAKKDARDTVENARPDGGDEALPVAAPPARRRRARKVRHPGFSREFEK